MDPVDAATAVRQILGHLRTAGIEPQTASTMRGVAGFPPSMMPKPKGQCRLLDGTVIVAAGEKDVRGDPIQTTILVDGHPVSFDAVGIAAVRLDAKGRLLALAGGGLKSFHGGGMTIQLPEPADVALWHEH